MNFLHLIRKYSVSTSGYLITTPIYYANGAPHLGHLYSSVIADTIFRYQKLTQFNEVSIFSTGTDEHGMKVLQAATSRNVPVSTYCDSVSQKYFELFKASNVGFTDYIRTTEDRHKKAVWEIWNVLKSKSSIYKDKYSGWYCLQDETFLTDTQLNIVGDKRFSIESGHPVEWTEEENYMFKLSDYQDDVIYWAKHEDRVVPKKFNKILLDMLHEDLPDISVSRPSHRMTWGIDVPDDPSQKVYVWLDALTNYLTVAGYPGQLKVWPPNLHVIGKDILKFHGIYWPAFLIAANLEPPKQLLVHSHWTVDGQKMSKSKQNVIDPTERASLYTMEGMRYFLLREGVAHTDGNYSDTKIIRYLNSELADTFGNLLSRACARSLNPNQKFPQAHSDHLNELIKTESCKILMENLSELPDKCRNHYESYNFHLVVDTVLAALHAANNFFETNRPWELKNKDDESTKRLETIISIAMESLRISATILQPIIPDFTNRLLDRLNQPKEQRFWKDSKLYMRPISCDLKDLGNNILFQRIILQQSQDDKKPPIKEKKLKMKKNK